MLPFGQLLPNSDRTAFVLRTGQACRHCRSGTECPFLHKIPRSFRWKNPGNIMSSRRPAVFSNQRGGRARQSDIEGSNLLSGFVRRDAPHWLMRVPIYRVSCCRKPVGGRSPFSSRHAGEFECDAETAGFRNFGAWPISGRNATGRSG